MIRCLLTESIILSFTPHHCSVALVFSSVCDVRERRGGSFVERIVSLFIKHIERNTRYAQNPIIDTRDDRKLK